MKIRKIIIENNKILWERIELDLVNQNWKVFDTVIFVWENGTWKSTLLNIIYEFSLFSPKEHNPLSNEKKSFELELNEDEYKLFKDNQIPLESNVLKIDIFLSKSGWNQIEIINNWKIININLINWNINLKSVFKSIFSDVSINFNPKNIENVKNNDTDIDVKTSKKSTENISTEITQMLVDIYNKDSWSLNEWVKSNKWLPVPENIIEIRTKRFKNSFNLMFKNNKLEYFWEKNLKPIFIKENQEIEIDELSSWEKQIVFRWGYLLKDKESIKWAIALIDEPEISLHPIWQQKILDFYTHLFKNEKWEQTSQIFITTHSPYVLQWYNLDDWWIFIFPWWKRIDNLRKYIWCKPSLWVVNYEAYNLPTVEFHDELYWYIYDKIKAKDLKNIDNYFKNNWSMQNRNRKLLKWSPYNITLQTFIRNKLHHPENTNMSSIDFSNEDLKKSIDDMIKIIKDNNL